MWYNGSFESKNKEARFGTKAFNSRTATWHGGKWLSGSFFSKLGTMVDVSEVHKYSIWRTGQWLSGNFYGGIVYNIDFKSGTWHGGVLEDIQIIGMNENNNSFILNGIFKFNIGDEFYVLNNNEKSELSLIFGSNDDPRKYTVLYTVEDSINKFTEVYVATNISEFSGNFISYRKFSNQFETLNTNSTVTNTIITDNVKETVSSVKVRLNIEIENKLIEKYVPVAQYISASPIIPVLDPLSYGGGTSWEDRYPGVPLQTNTEQSNFFSQNLIGVRLSNILGSVTLNWGINPIGYAGPGFSLPTTPLKYKLNTTMSSVYGSTYIATESILDAVTREELSSVNITSNTLYSISDEIYGYRIDISEDHLFGTYFAQYEVDVKYSHIVNGLNPNKYYYFRVMELKSSGIGGLRIRLKSPNGQIIGIKEFNEGNDDTNMRDTTFTYNQSFPNFDSGKPVYEGKYKMNLDTIGSTSKILTSKDLTDYSLISKNNYYPDFTNLIGTNQYVNGDWTILIENTSGINVGYLYEWEIQFGYTDTLGAQLNNRKSAINTGLYVVSNFNNANWKTGIWTNGVFNDGLFEAGIWYNGVFNGTWT
jgi:subtilisin-like proprotein convertase family protein